MILVDTGAWFPLFVATDPDHADASDWFVKNADPLLTTDYIVDETLTRLRARGQFHKALDAGRLFFGGNLAKLHFLTPAEINTAWQVFRTFTDKR